jgi:hypothetical protein
MPPAGALRLRDGPGQPATARSYGRLRGSTIPTAIDASEPSSRGPGRQGLSSSGALHLDALNHTRSTYVRADGRQDGNSRPDAAMAPDLPDNRHLTRSLTRTLGTRFRISA